MTKNELAQELAVSERLRLSTSFQAVDGIIRIIKQSLANGEGITIKGFGSFIPSEIAEHTAHNFQSGEPIVVPAHHGVRFRVSKELIKTLNAETANTPDHG